MDKKDKPFYIPLERVYGINPRTEQPHYLGTYRVYCGGWQADTGWIRARGGKRVKRLRGSNAWLLIHSPDGGPISEPNTPWNQEAPPDAINKNKPPVF